jgi:peptidoglycan/xylan/chitin deacetylase (PgdA/CDA1 family)
MYHSVSDEGPGPVSLPPAIFREQLAILADGGAQGVALSDYVAARRAGRPLPSGTTVLTFDDAYRDFGDIVFPLLEKYGWRATVFVPILPIDQGRPWDCGDGYPRPLLTWPVIDALAAAGVELAAHSMSHQDLTCLGPEATRAEIEGSGRRLRERTGRAVEGFAPPLGRTTPAIRREVARHFRWAAGTKMGRAREGSDPFDLPRIEMWYFRSARRLRRYARWGWTPYFAMRAAMRAARPWK